MSCPWGGQGLGIVVAFLVILNGPLVSEEITLFDLRDRLDGLAKDVLSAEEGREFSEAALGLASKPSSNGRFWSAIGFLGELCRRIPTSDAREIRGRALGLLAARNSDSLRWSSLLRRSFVPNFSEIPQSEWRSELREYDRILDALLEKATSNRVRGELRSAKVWPRVVINRRWDWLTARERLESIARLKSLVEDFGKLAVPGAKSERETIELREARFLHELENLHFGAMAPVTAGSDLEGEAIDLADFRGNVVILDFWTTFCQPCLALVPTVHGLLKRYQGRAVVYLGVNGDPDRTMGLATAKRFGMSWRNFWDGPLGPVGPIAKDWGVEDLGWPAVFVLDADGRIRGKLVGKHEIEDELDGMIEEVLGSGED